MNASRLCLACLSILASRGALAQCSDPPAVGEYWTQTFHHVVVPATQGDPAFDTDFTLTAPCKVFVESEFVVTAAAHDNLFLSYPWGRTVARSPRIWDDPENAATTILDHGTIVQTDELGDWTMAVATAYHGTPVNHVIGFRFEPGSTSHFWGAQTLLSAVTADPYPDAPAPAAPDAPAAGGCSTGSGAGAVAAAAAALALAAALRRRR